MYVTTASKSTTVYHSCKGSFKQGELNLVLAKVNHIDIYTATDEALVPLHELQMYGNIQALLMFRPEGQQTEQLFILTEKKNYSVLQYSEAQQKPITVLYGDVVDIGRLAERGPFVIMDPVASVIGLHLYEGMMKVIPISGGLLQNPFNVRIEDINIIDMCFAYSDSPSIAYLFQSGNGERFLKVRLLNSRSKTLEQSKFPPQVAVERTSTFVRALTDGAFLVCDEHGIQIISADGAVLKKVAHADPRIVKDITFIDSELTRWLVADSDGELDLLTIAERDMTLTRMGETSTAHTLAYLDNGVVFVGSKYGNNQLIRMKTELQPQTDDYLEVLMDYDNLAPIVDFCHVDLDGHGQGQLVTCSGAYKDGSLRIVRNGICINEEAELEMPNIKGMWALRKQTAGAFDQYLCVSFADSTLVLSMEDEELVDTQIPGFDGTISLYCGTVVGDQWLQITQRSVRLVSAASSSLNNEWNVDEGSIITVCAANSSQILVCIGGGKTLVYLEVDGMRLKEKTRVLLENEVACVDITALADERVSFCSVGLWTEYSVRLLELPSLATKHTEPLPGQVIPRSIVSATFGGEEAYLFVGLGDGHLLNYKLNPFSCELTERKNLAIATKPILLTSFTAGGVQTVFAASDRPTTIYAKGSRLLYSTVNLPSATFVCAFNTEAFPGCLAFADDQRLLIGSMEELQKIDIQTVKLGEMPRRIAALGDTFMVLTVKRDKTCHYLEGPNFVKLMDQSTFTVLDTLPLEPGESAVSIAVVPLGDDSYYVVGTADCKRIAVEPTEGRILVLKEDQGKIKLVTSRAVSGAVYALAPFLGGRLVAGVGSKMELLEWTTNPAGDQVLLNPVAEHTGNILVVAIRTRGEYIAIADVVKSVWLLRFNQTEGEPDRLELVARDYTPQWMTAMEMISADKMIGCDQFSNLFVLERDPDQVDSPGQLINGGRYHLGDMVNVFRGGSLVSNTAGDSVSGTLLFATVSGAIGVAAPLEPEDFAFYDNLQAVMAATITGVGNLEQSKYREYSTELEPTGVASNNFIDGDLVEALLELPRDIVENVATQMNMEGEELLKRVESFARKLH